MSSIYFFGECLIELRALQGNLLEQSYAGDIYNSAVYMKRAFPKLPVHIITTVGTDAFSNEMTDRFTDEHLSTELVFRSRQKIPGLYHIQTDVTGERTFNYWRGDSAARQTMDFFTDVHLHQFKHKDVFFFSGISLAILPEEKRDEFWHRLKKLNDRGITIVFDPNYRKTLWSSKDDALTQTEKAFTYADIALPGVDDLATLLDLHTSKQVSDFCQRFDLAELIIKNGPQSVVTVCNGATATHKITPVNNVVDTTSAGDAFNGVYLGARLSGKDIDNAVQAAAAAAATVIQHPGAIIPRTLFLNALQGKI
ncbi:sugar kinase [Salinimonas marina]|uniref:Sugar kinase n=1 Tax=Salinimonas marina TaxID=2785918 RepID=A0A7S9HC85_9ALTE|nr:sugar kinase [Salinimonas marina]QPG05016.1 sugar kinase [Salinimonas marina]